LFAITQLIAVHAEGGSAAQPRRIRELHERDAAFRPAADLIHQNATGALKAGPWSVICHRPEFIKDEANDYSHTKE